MNENKNVRKMIITMALIIAVTFAIIRFSYWLQDRIKADINGEIEVQINR